MATRKIVQVGDEVLRKRSFEVEVFNKRLCELLDDMKDTVIKEMGAGLAAPQVGVLKRAVVINLEEGYFELINPKITFESGQEEDYEGCLSVRGKKGLVIRPEKVKVVAQDRNGKKIKLNAEGFFARAICHEIDHLNGVLYIDKATNIENVEND